MKKVALLIICSIWAVIAYSQDYYPLIEEGKTWNVLVVAANYPCTWDTTFSTISYKLSGDTVINFIAYKKRYSSYEEIPAIWNLSGFMREDANRKLWMRETAVEDEFHMYLKSTRK